MTRFILRYRGEGAMPREDVERIRKMPRITVIDGDSPRMVLVEGKEPDLAKLAKSLPDWSITPERSIPLPDTRKKVKSTNLAKRETGKRAAV